MQSEVQDHDNNLIDTSFGSYDPKTSASHAGRSSSITSATYNWLDAAFHYFNTQLFGGVLEPAAITLQHKRAVYGYFHAGNFASIRGERANEIALNPNWFLDQAEAEILGTLVHEMAHHWQQQEGKPSRRGYHNKQWARKMNELGLIPSVTGKEGGRQTGQSVSHYIEVDGKFDRCCKRFLKRRIEMWGSPVRPRNHHEDEQQQLQENKPLQSDSKTRFCCPGCRQLAWAKPSAALKCANCNLLMEITEVTMLR